MISSAPAMTWLLVTITPEGSTTKPEPSEWTVDRCGAALFARPGPLKGNSSKGEPGGLALACPAHPLSGLLSGSACVVEILTTAGTSVSARSAKEPGGTRVSAAGACVSAGGAWVSAVATGVATCGAGALSACGAACRSAPGRPSRAAQATGKRRRRRRHRATRLAVKARAAGGAGTEQLKSSDVFPASPRPRYRRSRPNVCLGPTPARIRWEQAGATGVPFRLQRVLAISHQHLYRRTCASPEPA